MDNGTDVRDLALPTRVRNALIGAGYRTVGQLRPLLPQNDPLGFLHIRGIGVKGERAIIALFREASVLHQTDAGPTGTVPEGAPEPTEEQIAEIKRRTPGYGASVTWQDEIIRRAYQAGWVAAQGQGHL